MRKTFLTTTAAAAAVLGFAAAPADAATGDVTVPFAMTYGNSQTSGSIHFTAGYSASVSGVVHAASGVRADCPSASNGGTVVYGSCSSFAGVGTGDTTLSEDFNIKLPGGVQTIVINLVNENYTVLAQDTCTRSGCHRTY